MASGPLRDRVPRALAASSCGGAGHSGAERVNHQILRRTFASLAYNTGGDLKDIQAQMRHASANTTANVYTKPIPKSVRKAVEALDRRIRKRGQAKKS